MTRNSVFNYKFTTFTVRRAYSDAMWSWSMKIAEGYPVPAVWEPIEAIRTDENNIDRCLLVGIPVTKGHGRGESDHFNEVKGYSYGWYVTHRPILPAERLLTATGSGTSTTLEDPLVYLERLIHSTDNPCGLVKGTWDTAVTGWGTTTLPYQQFESTSSSNVQNAVDEICEYAGLYYLDYWKLIDGIWQPVTYLSADANLDTSYDLPAAITVDADTDDVRTMRVMVDANSEINGESWYNSVWVDGVIEGTTPTGLFTRWPETWDVATMGLERPYIYPYGFPEGTTTADATTLISTKCAYLYDLLTISSESFTVKFFDRYDLQLMQQITFLNFEDITELPLRITEVEYTIDQDSGCVCTCTCTSDRAWSAMRKLSILLKQGWASVAQRIKQANEAKTNKVAYTTVATTYTTV